ncbi:hypothetical protein KKC63_02245 [Patescibacteria group bacterium]|nr:hypothetical protein [Patescibacteria group bacterium]MBU4023100.1 hypothetical protein [Patescibacteria group bacterium]MBU4078344.1 hypothetical protein [Patescibacteria group bacterium]
MLKKKIDKQLIANMFNSFFWFLAERAFLSLIILCLIIFFVAGMVFYFYAYLPTISEPKAEIRTISVNETVYKQFISNYSQRKEKLYTIGLEDSKDLFYRD